MPSCPLQPDLLFLNKFREKEHEYSRERNASPFRWIDRSGQRKKELFVDCDDSSDEDFEDYYYGEGGGGTHPTHTRSTAPRELIHYKPPVLQPTKLAEKLAREYKKWHGDMTVKIEEKKAEAKRKGNKNDFSLTPRQDKKKKDSFNRKSSNPDKISATEYSPRQARSRPETSSPRKSARDKSKESKSGDGWVKPPLGKSLSSLPSLTSHIRSSTHDSHKGAPVRQPESSEDGDGGSSGRLMAKGRLSTNIENLGSIQKKLTNSSGIVGTEASTERSSRGNSSLSARHTMAPLSSAKMNDLMAGAGAGFHGSAGGGEADDSATASTLSSSAGERRSLPADSTTGDGGGSGAEFAEKGGSSSGSSETATVKEKEKAEGSFLASLKSMANRTKTSAKRKSATTSDLPAMMNMIDVHAANAARAGLAGSTTTTASNNNASAENGLGSGSENESGSVSGRASSRGGTEKRERSDSAKDKLRTARSGSDGGCASSGGGGASGGTGGGMPPTTPSGKNKEKEKADSHVNTTTMATTVHHTKAEKDKDKDGKKSSKKTKRSSDIKNS